MKKFFLVTFICCLIFSFCGCSGKEEKTNVSESQAVASEICKIEDYESYSDETIKALAVIIKSNIKNGENYSTEEYSIPDQHILELVNQTEYLFEEDEIKDKISINKNENWEHTVSKSKLLEIFAEKNESVSSIKDISLEKNADNRVTAIIVAGKRLTIQDIEDKLKLKSNKIDSINLSSSSVTFFGKGSGFGKEFDVSLAEELAQNGNSYEEIIKHFKNSYKTIKN